MTSRTLLQSHAEEATGTPFVLVDNDVAVVEDGVVHDKSGTYEETWGDVEDDGKTFVEYHVETDVFGFFAFSVYCQVVAVEDYECRHDGEMEEPSATKYPVVAISASDADVTEVDADFRRLRIARFEGIGSLKATSLVTEAG